MKKTIKIKESNVLDIINKIIKEEIDPTGPTEPANPIVVSASGGLGTAPNFDGLRAILKTLKVNVEKALRGSVPYRIKSDNKEGVAKASKSGDTLRLDVTLVPVKEEDRQWYFDGALAIYSIMNPNAAASLKAKIVSKLSEKSTSFYGAEDKVNIIGYNTIGLSNFKNLDPTDPNKTYAIYIGYIAANRPDGYQEVADDNNP